VRASSAVEEATVGTGRLVVVVVVVVEMTLCGCCFRLPENE
jgi:hypothetical protein